MKKTGCIALVLFLALCGSLFFNLLLVGRLGGSKITAGAARIVREKKFEEQLVSGSAYGDKIAVIPLDGLIAFSHPGAHGNSMVDDLKLAFAQAAEDPDVKAIVLAVDSPGGEVTASDVLYNSVKKLARKKPVIVYFNSIGTSGAYYTACGASWIMCNDTTFTASIGVIISTLNYRELFGKIGLESVIFKSGKFKDLLSGSREMTPDEKAYVEGLVMQSYERFLGIVAGARKLDANALRNGVADGRIMSGTDALREKLVDQLGYIEDAYAKARELAASPRAGIVRYRPAFNFEKLFGIFGASDSAKIQFDLPQGLSSFQLQPGRVYLLPSICAP